MFLKLNEKKFCICCGHNFCESCIRFRSLPLYGICEAVSVCDECIMNNKNEEAEYWLQKCSDLYAALLEFSCEADCQLVTLMVNAILFQSNIQLEEHFCRRLMDSYANKKCLTLFTLVCKKLSNTTLFGQAKLFSH